MESITSKSGFKILIGNLKFYNVIKMDFIQCYSARQSYLSILENLKSDVFHVHNEHEFHVNSEEWIQKIKAKELEMIAWQQANLDIIIPGFLLY